MKNLFTLFALTMLPTFALGQSYFKEGTTWKTLVTSTSTPDSPPVVEVSTLSGQEVVDGYNAMKLYTMSNRDESTATFRAYIRTDNDKVYFKQTDSESEEWHLMYDFGLAAGEGCYVTHAGGSGVDGLYKTYIKCTGISDDASGLKIMLLEEYKDEKCESLYGTGKWLKGLASENGVEYNTLFDMDGGGTTLIEAYNGCEVFYSKTVTDIANARHEDFCIQIDGNSLNVSGANEQKTAIYTADGRRIAYAAAADGTANLILPGPGMYILKAGDKVKKIMAR